LLPPLLLTGGPAVGKTVTARALADAVPRTAYLDVDDLRHLVRNGHAAPWDDGAAQQLLGVRNAAVLARNFLASGFNVAITDVATRQTLTVYRTLLPDLVFIHLTTSLAEARRRARIRPVYLTDEEFQALTKTSQSCRPRPSARGDAPRPGRAAPPGTSHLDTPLRRPTHTAASHSRTSAHAAGRAVALMPFFQWAMTALPVSERGYDGHGRS
jgi:predicted ATPase